MTIEVEWSYDWALKYGAFPDLGVDEKIIWVWEIFLKEKSLDFCAEQSHILI